MFLSYNKITNTIPNCPSCNRLESVLVDFVRDDHDSQGTIPVWQCTTCQTIFGDRAYELKGALDGCHTITNKSLDGHEPNVQNAVENAIVSKIQNQPYCNLGIELDKKVSNNWMVSNLASKVEQLERKINDFESDPLTFLRKRVKDFTLT